MTLCRYREETKKIFVILRRFCSLVEKASCDEAFLDVTREVEYLFRHKTINYEK